MWWNMQTQTLMCKTHHCLRIFKESVSPKIWFIRVISLILTSVVPVFIYGLYLTFYFLFFMLHIKMRHNLYIVFYFLLKLHMFLYSLLLPWHFGLLAEPLMFQLQCTPYSTSTSTAFFFFSSAVISTPFSTLTLTDTLSDLRFSSVNNSSPDSQNFQ